jgi:hypothetical protein
MTEKFTNEFFSDPNEKKEDNTWESRIIYGPNLPPTLDVECEQSPIIKEYVDIVELNKRVESLEALTASLKEEVKVLTETLETYLISKELATIVKSLKIDKDFILPQGIDELFAKTKKLPENKK